MKSLQQVWAEIEAGEKRAKAAKQLLDKYIDGKENDVFIRMAAVKLAGEETRLEALKWVINANA